MGKMEQRRIGTLGARPGRYRPRDAPEVPQGVKVTSTASNRVNAKVDKERPLQGRRVPEGRAWTSSTSPPFGRGLVPGEQDAGGLPHHLLRQQVTAELVVDLPRDTPEVDSITPLWGGANWHERET